MLMMRRKRKKRKKPMMLTLCRWCIKLDPTSLLLVMMRWMMETMVTTQATHHNLVMIPGL